MREEVRGCVQDLARLHHISDLTDPSSVSHRIGNNYSGHCCPCSDDSLLDAAARICDVR